MTCPFCAKDIHPGSPPGPMGLRSPQTLHYNDGDGDSHVVEVAVCPSCSGVFLLHKDVKHLDGVGGSSFRHEENEYVLLPRVGAKPPPSRDVPEPYWSLYREASLILYDSPRCSSPSGC